MAWRAIASKLCTLEDVEREQDHDRITYQFPMYWYSVTPLLKKWLDDVLTDGFAYGSTGNKLEGKDPQVIVSVEGHPRSPPDGTD